MPAGDRTGPWGQGPLTGRGLGYCAGFDSPGYTRSFGGGMGLGRRFRFRGGRAVSRWLYGRRGWWMHEYHPYTIPPFHFYSEPSGEEELKYLKAEAEQLKKYHKEIEKRISDLEKKNASEG